METKFIVINGHNNILNEIICYTLQKELAVPSFPLHDIQKFETLYPFRETGTTLLMVDVSENGLETVFQVLERSAESCTGTCSLIPALFNLNPDGHGIERQALKRGFRGFFYRGDTLSLLLKGVRTLFCGEIWLSRNILLEIALNESLCLDRLVLEDCRLTPREIEILKQLRAGAANEEISELLCISAHTVKTHLYNIFRKINVKNRIQAALWASKNL